MNKKHVTSLELSKQLKEAGVEQKSEFYWLYLTGWTKPKRLGLKDEEYEIIKLVSREEMSAAKNGWNSGYFNCYSAFTASELGEMLPDTFHVWKGCLENEEGDWLCARFSEPEFDSSYEHFEQANTMSEVMGKMLLYLIQENSLKI